VAIGWQDETYGWVSRGWYKLQPFDGRLDRGRDAFPHCLAVFDGPLPNRYYYFYASNDNDRLRWAGNHDRTGAKFCVQWAAFYFSYISNCSGLQFKLIDTSDSINHVVNLADKRDPRQAALDCQNEISRGLDASSRLDAFSKCWIKNTSTERQGRILDCFNDSRTYESFAICATKGNMNNNEFNVANCVAEYGSNSQAELVKCLARGRLTNDESQILNCFLDNPRARNITACAAGQRLSADQRRIFDCVRENRRSYLDMGVCVVGSQVSPEQRRIARCITNYRGSYIKMGLCAAGSKMTYEQEVFVSCAIEYGVSWAFVGCYGGQLTAT